ncbi:hypothetical protein GCM10007854_00030 [Algimonas porphyrae]|uniref:Uncharacterized protein n=1 Tax=Algimonas porphyrae TaxID=1128113 RepID=A0ABQ5UV74_9PROT|nr:hypothetical protein GCM10007854_00030 [Algimonas porphyrae]
MKRERAPLPNEIRGGWHAVEDMPEPWQDARALEVYVHSWPSRIVSCQYGCAIDEGGDEICGFHTIGKPGDWIRMEDEPAVLVREPVKQ